MVNDFIEEINDKVERFVMNNFECVTADFCVTADKCGLDIRAVYSLYVNEEAIAVRFNELGTLNYYGGFEYVDKEFVNTIGDFTFFMADDDRVRDCINRFYNCESMEEETE